MKPVFALASLALLTVPLAACGGKGDDKLGRQVEQAADNRADRMEAMADNLQDRAEQVRENGKDRSDAIDAADVNAEALSNEQRAEIIANDAAAVR